MRRENLLASLLVLQSRIGPTYAATPVDIQRIGSLIEAVVGEEYGKSTAESPTTQFPSSEAQHSASTLQTEEASSQCSSPQCTTGMMSSVMQTHAGVVPAASLTNPTTILGTATSNDPSETPQRGGSTSAFSALLGTAPTVLASYATAVVVHTSSGDYDQDGASAASLLGLSAITPFTYLSPTLAATATAQMSDSDRIPTAVIFPISAEVDPTRTTGPRPETTEPPNALGVLYSALPSDVAASIASELDIDTTRFVTSERTSSTTRSTSATESTTSPASSTLSTITRSSSTTSATARPTETEAPTTSSSTQLRQGSIAGIATGVTAAVVLIVLAALLVTRRKKQGKPLFGAMRRSASKRSNRAYPEVAWLYDPATTPPRTSMNHARGESGISLLPTAYEGAAGVAGDTAAGGRFYDPEARLAAGPASPLLPPQLSYAREESPGSSPTRNGRGRSARSSVQSVTKMGPIHEEPHIH